MVRSASDQPLHSFIVQEYPPLNNRKRSNALTHQDLRSIMSADARATTLGLGLNMLITFHPRDSQAMPLQRRLYEFKRVRNCYCQFGRQHGFERACIWIREVEPENGAEHLHMLCHVPAHLRKRIIANAPGWGREPGACHARNASTREYWSRRSFRFSDLLYICKQMSPQAAYLRPYRRIAGGPIDGARWGASRNLKEG